MCFYSNLGGINYARFGEAGVGDVALFERKTM
jgi:hypothetical protein